MSRPPIVCLFTVGLVLVLLGGAARGQSAEEETAYGRWWLRPAIAKTLKLDQPMIRRLDELYLLRKSRLIDLKAAVQKERVKLQVLMDQEPLDKQAVMLQYEALNELRGVLGRERFTYYLEVRELLGPERYREAVAIHRERREKARQALKEMDAQDAK